MPKCLCPSWVVLAEGILSEHRSSSCSSSVGSRSEPCCLYMGGIIARYSEGCRGWRCTCGFSHIFVMWDLSLAPCGHLMAGPNPCCQWNDIIILMEIRPLCITPDTIHTSATKQGLQGYAGWVLLTSIPSCRVGALENAPAFPCFCPGQWRIQNLNWNVYSSNLASCPWGFF